MSQEYGAACLKADISIKKNTVHHLEAGYTGYITVWKNAAI